MINKRHLSPYEKNQLIKAGLEENKLNWHELGDMPIEYITGKVNFCGYDFIVDKSVLIPRVESEALVELALKSNPKTILDMGCGSGALGLSLAAKLAPNKERDLCLVDISCEALEIAKANFRSLRLHKILSNKIKINPIQSNLFEQLLQTTKFDLILANLPYIPDRRHNELEKSVIDFEPHLALFGGEHGETIINQFLVQLPNYLAENGVALLEIDGPIQLKFINLANLPQTWSISTHQDCFGVTRFVRIESR